MTNTMKRASCSVRAIIAAAAIVVGLAFWDWWFMGTVPSPTESELCACTLPDQTISIACPRGHSYSLMILNQALAVKFTGRISFLQRGHVVVSLKIDSADEVCRSNMVQNHLYQLSGSLDQYLHGGQRYDMAVHFSKMPAPGSKLALDYMQNNFQWRKDREDEERRR